MDLSRRDFLRASSALAAAWGFSIPESAEAATGGPTVVWLQGQGCSGCSVSFLNSITLGDAAGLLTNTLNVAYQPTVMSAAFAQAVAVAQAAYDKSGYILVVEGAIPSGASGKYAYLWDGMTVYDGVKQYASRAKYVIGLGTCAAFGGIPKAKPNPTGVVTLSTLIGTSKLINIPGCPSHPDWLVGTVSQILTSGSLPALDSSRRPTAYFGRSVHDRCPYRGEEDQCLKEKGCKGPKTRADCPSRKWNSPAANGVGVNWCIGAGDPWGSPCHGCTEVSFPDSMTPFYNAEKYTGTAPNTSGSGGNTGSDGGNTGGTNTGGTDTGDDDLPRVEDDNDRPRDEEDDDDRDLPRVEYEDDDDDDRRSGSSDEKKKQTEYQRRQEERKREYEKKREENKLKYEKRRLSGLQKRAGVSGSDD